MNSRLTGLLQSNVCRLVVPRPVAHKRHGLDVTDSALEDNLRKETSYRRVIVRPRVVANVQGGARLAVAN